MINLVPLVLALGCAPSPRPIAAPTIAPVVSVVLEGDREFYGHERAALVRATALLHEQTRGCVDLRIDFDGPDRPQRIWRNVSKDRASVATFAHFGTPVYGWTVLGEAHVVMDLHVTDRAITHTAMHELLHVVGVKHAVGNPFAVMAPNADARTDPLVLVNADRVAITAAIGCTW